MSCTRSTPAARTDPDKRAVLRARVRICPVGAPRTAFMDTFTGVVTTGIYCRAGCPAQPLRRNMLPFDHPAAAEAAGFRPCLRCRPDRVPDIGWIAAPELVCRAMHCIADGALDDATEDDLATRLGVSARHLRRLFAEYVGATPSDVARSRRGALRAPPARRHRSADDADRDRCGLQQRPADEPRRCTRCSGSRPTELRAKRRQPDRLVVDGGLELRVPYRPPLAWRALLEFLAPRAIPGVEAVDLDASVYRRIADIDGAPGVIEVWDVPREQALHLRAHLPAIDGLVHLVAGVRRLFDLDADPKADRPPSRARSRGSRPLVRARTRTAGSGRARPVRARRPRDSRPAGLGRARDRARGRARRAARQARAGCRVRSGSRTSSRTPRSSRGPTSRRSGCTTARIRALQGLRRRRRERRSDPRPRHGPRRDRARPVRAPRASGRGPRTTSRCARAANATRSRPRISRSATRSAPMPVTVAEPWRPWRAYAAMHIWTAGHT